MQLNKDEEKAVIAAFNNPDATQVNGIRLAGQKFFTLSASTNSVYGKKAVCVSLLIKYGTLHSDYF
jgi:profilin